MHGPFELDMCLSGYVSAYPRGCAWPGVNARFDRRT